MKFSKENGGSTGPVESEPGGEARTRANRSGEQPNTRARSSDRPGGVPGGEQLKRGLVAAGVWTFAIALALALGTLPIALADDTTFDGEISFNGSEATDGSSWSYEISDVESVDNFGLDLEGQRVTEDRSESITTDDGTLDLETRGTGTPENAEVTLEGLIDTEERSESWSALSDGNSREIDVGGNLDDDSAEVTFTGHEDTEQRSASGSGVDSGSESIDIGGNADPTDATLTIDDHEPEGTWEDESSHFLGTDTGESATYTAQIDGHIERVEADVFFENNDGTNSKDTEVQLLVDGEVVETHEQWIASWGETVSTVGSDVDIEADGEVDVTVEISDGHRDVETTVENATADYYEPVDLDVEASDGSTVSFDTSGSESLDMSTDTDSLEFTGSGEYDWSLEWTDVTRTHNPEIEIDGETASHSGYLHDGESVTETLTVGPGEHDVDLSTGYDTDVDLDWTERTQTHSPVVEVAGETVAHNGLLDEGEAVSESISLDRNEEYDADVWSDGPVSATVEWTDVSDSRDAEVTINGYHSVGVDGVLEEGETESMDVDEDWIHEGENNLEVSLADANGGPVPQVGVKYSHDAATVATADVDSTTWAEDVEVSREFASDQSDVDATVPMPENVVEVDSLELQRNGDDWQTVDSDQYELDGTDLVVDIGDVNAGENLSVRASADKVRTLSGAIEVEEPTTEGNTLDTRMRVVYDGGSDPVKIDVSETVTAERIHHLTDSDWGASDDVRVTASGEQVLRIPNAVEGSETSVRTAPLTVDPQTGEAIVEIDNVSEPRFSVDAGSNAGDALEVGYHDTTSGQHYELVSITDDRVVDSATASSPVWFDIDDASATYYVDETEPSSTITVPVDGEGSQAAGPLLIVASLAGLTGSVVVGRRVGLGNWMLVPATIVVFGIGIELTTPRSFVSTVSGDLLHGTSGPLMALLGTAAALGLLWSIDSRTRRRVPRSLYALLSLGGSVWLVSAALADSADPVISVIVGMAVVTGVFVLDQQTRISIPTPIQAGVSAVGIVWILESISEGMVRDPLMDGLGEVAPLVILAGVGAVLLVLRRWLSGPST